MCSVEDPVEIPIAGLNQTQIHPRAGLTFQGVLRRWVRHWMSTRLECSRYNWRTLLMPCNNHRDWCW
ncbi:ATPase, T2SS/T4P/T4SS family [Haemophilus influenzae]|uniref:ATPase, T2SS/T4P/T4SS family n=1 Tax=Haemophilus influenzae TaxID=727 RepID=UPI0034DDA963